MSFSYRPGQIPTPTGNASSDVKALTEALRAELLSLNRGLNRSQPYGQLDYLHAAPDKTFSGMLVLADGTDWNPGSGAGAYRRSEDNASWVHLG